MGSWFRDLAQNMPLSTSAQAPGRAPGSARCCASGPFCEAPGPASWKVLATSRRESRAWAGRAHSASPSGDARAECFSGWAAAGEGAGRPGAEGGGAQGGQVARQGRSGRLGPQRVLRKARAGHAMCVGTLGAERAEQASQRARGVAPCGGRCQGPCRQVRASGQQCFLVSPLGLVTHRPGASLSHWLCFLRDPPPGSLPWFPEPQCL